ncbi:MAG: ribonuclease HII [Actinobacteria bacterium]|nr:ribonuclease HII [Actinomycetota bacterium]MBL7060399.1 ribonuclease HII [Actinomycetota bacterium]
MKFEEIERLKRLCVYEDNLFLNGYKKIAGVDEVGRGPLAGPIVAAAVILDRKKILIENLNDSKKISKKNRELVFREILNSCITWSIAKIPPRVIDDISINKANILVIKEAIQKLKIKPDIVISDAIDVKMDIKVIPIINGDEKSASIAAASIIAKVIRDKIMMKLSRDYPEYSFEYNKGYGTKEHLKNLQKYGPSKMHRMSFRGVLN